MITALSKEQIKSKYKIEISRLPKVSLYGGLRNFCMFLEKSGLKERLTVVLGERATAVVLQILLGICVGKKTMEDISEATKDPVILDYIGRHYSATQMVRILRKVRKQRVQDLHEFTLSNALLDIAGDCRKGLFQTIDIDAMSVEKYGHQEGVEIGYLENDILAPCYSYLIVKHDELNSILYGTIRAGSAHSQNDICEFLRMILPSFNSLWSLRIREDSGFFNENAMDVCGEYDTQFYIKAPMSQTRKAQALSPHLEWKACKGDPENEYATVDCVTKKDLKWREVFKRTPNKAKPGEYFYACVATNDTIKNGFEVFEHHNGRARIENTNCELHHDMALGRLVTKWFDVNDIITQTTIILFQMLSHFKRHYLDKADKDKRLSTIRQHFFNIASEIMRTSRRVWLRLYSKHLDILYIGRILARIEASKKVFVVAWKLSSA
jgi:hypothetical protein